MVAFLGTGLLGANFVRAMINRGEKVQVWNRTPSKATALEQYGAMVTSRGFIYLHAPVFMGPPNALDSTGSMLVSGDRQIVDRFSPILAKMTGKLLDFGPEAGRAAAMKLLGNLFLVAFTTGIADTLMLAKGMHVPVSDLSMLFDNWNPGAMLPNRLKRMTSGNYSSPSWELNMARKDTGLFLQEAKKGGVTLAVIPAVAAEMDRWIQKGHGADDWTVIAKDAAPSV